MLGKNGPLISSMQALSNRKYKVRYFVIKLRRKIANFTKIYFDK